MHLVSRRICLNYNNRRRNRSFHISRGRGSHLYNVNNNTGKQQLRMGRMM